MEQNNTMQQSNREVKSSAFTTYFSDPQNAAQLYSALEGVEVSPEDIHFTTLEGVLFVARKNDMAFTVKNRVLVISEHQSTVNNNMPLRDVIYYGRTMEKLIDPKTLYRRKLVTIPTPEFYVFYNGDEPYPAEKVMKLSDAYLDKSKAPMLELTVKVININLPENHALLSQCRPLYEYSWFIQRIKDYMADGMNRDSAITQTIKDCEREGIMVDFVRKHGTEAVNMLFTQFNLDDAMEVRYEEGVEDGIEKGIERGELLKLIQQVQRKQQKGLSIEDIAADLEEEQSLIEKISAAIEQSPSSATLDEIYKTFQTIK